MSETTPKGYWTKAKVLIAARNFQSRTQFKQEDPKAYSAALRNRWLEEACDHMQRKKRPNGYWTKQRCKEEARKFSTVKEFKSSSDAAYSTALQKGWKAEICNHMVAADRARQWALERCVSVARRYSTKMELRSSKPSVYATIMHQIWEEPALKHMVQAKGYLRGKKVHHKSGVPR